MRPDTSSQSPPGQPRRAGTEAINVPDELLVLALSAATQNPPTTDVYDLIDYSVDEQEAMERALAAVLAQPATRPRYQGRAAVAAMLGVSSDLLAHWMRRHPDGIPAPDAEVEEAGRSTPLWLPGRETEWHAWRATFPGRTGRPRRDAQSNPKP